jgi:catechol 2,3-dioxygenase-like lactoylglutathione lyase family enzyme
MKRLHVHVHVSDLNDSVRFYSTMFAAEPTVRKDDYAKWMLEDPRVNFAISTGAGASGLSHLGIQAESDAELAEVATRLKASGAQMLEQKAEACCYALSDKEWVTDPSGIKWESFFTFGESDVLTKDPQPEAAACCAPKPEAAPACCAPKAEAAPAPSACCGAAPARE